MLNSFLEKKSKENLDVLTGEIGQKFSRPTWGLVSSSTEKKCTGGAYQVLDWQALMTSSVFFYSTTITKFSDCLRHWPDLHCLSQWSLTQFQILSLRIGPTGIKGSMVVAFRL